MFLLQIRYNNPFQVLLSFVIKESDYGVSKIIITHILACKIFNCKTQTRELLSLALHWSPE